MIIEKPIIKQVKQHKKQYHYQGEDKSISDEIVRVKAPDHFRIRNVGMSGHKAPCVELCTVITKSYLNLWDLPWIVE